MFKSQSNREESNEIEDPSIKICLIERRVVQIDRNAIAEIVREMYQFGITTVSNWKSELERTAGHAKNLQVVKQLRKEREQIWVRIALRQVRLDGQFVGLATRVINHSAYTKLRDRLQKTLGTCRSLLSFFFLKKKVINKRKGECIPLPRALFFLFSSSTLIVDRTSAFCE